LKTYAELEIEPPLVIMLSFLGVKGYKLYVAPDRFPSPSAKFNQNAILIPELVVEDTNPQPTVILRPIFDLVWQTFGFLRSFNYSDKGEWRAR
jgi:hypothetical protein